jgi:hypothetical protein
MQADYPFGRPAARYGPPMTTVRRAIAAVFAGAAVLAAAPSASVAPAPFGRACTLHNGTRFCPTADLASRVRSFDGVPLDVDVTLPPTGDGPFPAILLLHGLGGTKTSFQRLTGEYTNWAFARRGYAVVTPTARGFGASCGTPASRTAGCQRGWARLGDIRYEIRDVQHLTGLLVDQGVVRPDAIGATGVSYGGGMSTMLAHLRDRVRRTNGSFAPWRSPKNRRIRLRAAWPRWAWTNGEGIFIRNGRGAWSRRPIGVNVEAWADAIFGVAFRAGFVAPPDGELSADLTGWKRLLDAGSTGPKARAVLENSWQYHGVTAVGGTPAPLLFQSGWTDALFPAPQVLADYDRLLAADPRARVGLQLGDLGHGAGSHALDDARFEREGIAFLDAWLLGTVRKPPPGQVTVFTTTCPRDSPAGGGPYVARRFADLARGSLAFRAGRTLRLTHAGGDAALGSALGLSGADCQPRPPDPATSATTFSAPSTGVTLLGRPLLTGRVQAEGRFGQIAARLWDLDPATSTQRLVTRGAYRLRDDQRERFRFALDGNGWRFDPGHRIVVELLGRDEPAYRASPGPFSATLTSVQARLPLRDRE